MMNCGHCDASLPPDARFCGSCGQSVGDPAMVSTAVGNQREPRQPPSSPYGDTGEPAGSDIPGPLAANPQMRG